MVCEGNIPAINDRKIPHTGMYASHEVCVQET